MGRWQKFGQKETGDSGLRSWAQLTLWLTPTNHLAAFMMPTWAEVCVLLPAISTFSISWTGRQEIAIDCLQPNHFSLCFCPEAGHSLSWSKSMNRRKALIANEKLCYTGNSSHNPFFLGVPSLLRGRERCLALLQYVYKYLVSLD